MVGRLAFKEDLIPELESSKTIEFLFSIPLNWIASR